MVVRPSTPSAPAGTDPARSFRSPCSALRSLPPCSGAFFALRSLHFGPLCPLSFSTPSPHPSPGLSAVCRSVPALPVRRPLSSRTVSSLALPPSCLLPFLFALCRSVRSHTLRSAQPRTVSLTPRRASLRPPLHPARLSHPAALSPLSDFHPPTVRPYPAALPPTCCASGHEIAPFLLSTNRRVCVPPRPYVQVLLFKMP